jgi:hypothetical protein
MCARPLIAQHEVRMPTITNLRGIDVAAAYGGAPVHGFVIALGLSSLHLLRRVPCAWSPFVRWPPSPAAKRPPSVKQTA